MSAPTSRCVAEWLFAACGVWLAGLGLYFIFLRPALLPEDLRYMGVDAQALQAAAPLLASWLRKVFAVMGGFMAGSGVLIIHFSWNVLPQRPPGASVMLAMVGALTMALMSVVNFALGSDFRWLLLAPPVAWAAATVAYVRSAPAALGTGR